ncbi:hypothetical protein [uncultured Oscillibacter sp.]|uniref:hypothetical protein n=1 Tax=uncultured Oscillibacter sp. TaxID=876091 RepID=UPI00260C3B8C|nr:hypothetical protein [uncultured Oscillibacter sp.]
MNHENGNYLCLSDLLDQDLSAYEFYQTLSPEERRQLEREEDGVTSFSNLLSRLERIRDTGIVPD